jgi:hypothetical protein
MPHDSDYWFPAKRYGWGWGPPNSWHGWSVLAGFVALIALGAATILPHSHAGFIAYVVVLSVLSPACAGGRASRRDGDGAATNSISSAYFTSRNLPPSTLIRNAERSS